MIVCIFLRSLLLQAFWNFERMQNVGFLFSLLPFLRKIYPNIDERREAIKRHLGYFNTHPYLANIIIGLTMAGEKKLKENKTEVKYIMNTKTNMSSPLAALGDRFFWSTWRTFAGIIVSLFFLLSENLLTIGSRYILVAIVTYLIIFNLLHIPVRFFGLVWSFKNPENIIKLLADFRIQIVVKKIQKIGVVLILFGSICYLMFNLSLKESIIFTIIFIFSYLYSEVTSVSFIFYISTIIAFILCILFRFM